MPLIPINIPPGVYKNATPYAAKNRYSNANRVRWHNGSARAIGGWDKTTDSTGAALDPITATPDTETVRDGFSWTDNSSKSNLAFGSNAGLYHLVRGSTIKTVTPVGFTGGPNVPTYNTGYGKGLYGAGLYGAPRAPTASATRSIFRWNFGSWGEDLIAGYTDTNYRGPIFAMSPTDTVAVQIPNAPTDVNGLVVTDQRMIMTIGSNSEARLVQWSDRENREVWTPDIANYAGSQFLTGAGALMSINKVLNQVLILSETDAHVARFIGAPFVYGFDRVGTDCGPVHAGAVQVTDRFAVWMGRRQFWMYDGTVRPLPCDLMDFLADDISTDNIAKVTSGVIPQFNEVWWLYQSNDDIDGDVDKYVSYDYVAGHWSLGSLSRTVLVSSHGLDRPVMIRTSTQKLEDHENQDAFVSSAWVETGPIELGQGDRNLAVRYIFPDTQVPGRVDYTLYGKEMPTAEEFTYGPYDYNNPVSTRAMGREIRMRVRGRELGWELGPSTRFDVAPVGTGTR